MTAKSITRAARANNRAARRLLRGSEATRAGRVADSIKEAKMTLSAKARYLFEDAEGFDGCERVDWEYHQSILQMDEEELEAFADTYDWQEWELEALDE